MEALKPGFGTIIWMLIAFSLVFYILVKYAWKPILSFLKDREDSIAEALLAAQSAKEEMSKLKADNEKIIAEAKVDRDKIIKEARELKDSIIADAKNQATDETKKMIEIAKQSIRSERDSVINEMKEQIVTLSIDIAGKILHQKLSDNTEQQELIEKSLRDVKLN